MADRLRKTVSSHTAGAEGTTTQETLQMNHREASYALLRITLGVIFLFYGIGKFMGGIGNFVGGLNQQFSGKLPAAMVMPFAYVIPFAETISGALILLGLF